MRKSFLLTAISVILLVVTVVQGQVPGLLSYQGKLIDAVGDPVADGSYPVEFRLWRDAVSTAPADELWASGLVNVNTVDGLFSIILGQSPMPPIDPFLFVADTNVWLGITIGVDPELSPRSRMTGVSYSMFSQYTWQSHLSDSATGAEEASRAWFADSTEAITDGGVDFADIGQNGAASGEIIKWNGSAWAAATDDVGGSEWNWSDSSSHGPDSVLFADSSNHADDATTAGFADSTGAITDGGVDFADIGQNGAASGEIIKWNGSAWAAATDKTGGGSGGWTDDGTVVRLDAATDSVGIGTTTPSEVLEVMGNIKASGKATIGQGHTNTGLAGFVAGKNNTLTGKSASISGGTSNNASGNSSTIGGGSSNNTIGTSSMVGGGERNTASGHASTVAGGTANTAAGDSSFVGGGSQNGAIGLKATVAGGHIDTASGDYATVGGGRVNIASAYSATVSGGNVNSAIGNYATVSGGNDNEAGSASSTVGGGNANTASGVFSTLSGGSSNTASGSYSALGGGKENHSIGNYSIVGGGIYDTASGNYSVVSGGVKNTASGDTSFVGGGSGNIAGGRHATISGGRNNLADSAYSTVAGGLSNQAGNLESTVGGGNSNLASGVQSTVGGGAFDTASGSRSTISGGIDNNADGYASTVAGGEQNSASGDKSFVGGGRLNTASGQNAIVPGGYYNTASGDFSLAAGRKANAIHDGSFVWGDSSDAHVSSTKPNQFTVRAANGVNLVSNANPANPIEVGERFRDNGIIAWGRVQWNGDLDAEFGVTSVVRNFNGSYTITIEASATSVWSLAPIAQPVSSGVRIATVDVISSNVFEVQIYDKFFTGLDNDFVFMVTAR